jgi:hypothetical protein
MKFFDKKPSYDISDHERKNALTKQIAIILLCVSAPYFFIFHALGLSTLGNAVIPIDLLLVLALFLNKNKQNLFAKYITILVPAVGTLYYARVTSTEECNLDIVDKKLSRDFGG